MGLGLTSLRATSGSEWIHYPGTLHPLGPRASNKKGSVLAQLFGIREAEKLFSKSNQVCTLLGLSLAFSWSWGNKGRRKPPRSLNIRASNPECVAVRLGLSDLHLRGVSGPSCCALKPFTTLIQRPHFPWAASRRGLNVLGIRRQAFSWEAQRWEAPLMGTSAQGLRGGLPEHA